jgi:UDP-2-acetamido-3-amino-2,3-dideoxy-glucuronate N-acetyltransferase
MTHPDVTIAPTADVDARAEIGAGTRIWNLAQIREDAALGRNCTIGRGAYVGPGVTVGDNVKLQNYALVYEPARLGDGVFIGPAAVLTNDEYPRAVTPSGRLKTGDDWTPVTVGRWALVAAGAVVTKDVPDFALVVGVPARRVGWVGRAGRPLIAKGDGVWVCPSTGEEYVEDASTEKLSATSTLDK